LLRTDLGLDTTGEYGLTHANDDGDGDSDGDGDGGAGKADVEKGGVGDGDAKALKAAEKRRVVAASAAAKLLAAADKKGVKLLQATPHKSGKKNYLFKLEILPPTPAMK
jgi:hypothetical protein